MPGNAGPLGDIAAVCRDSAFELEDPHGLADGMLVRLREGPLRLECYVKPDPQSANLFQVYKDRECKETASLRDFHAGAHVELLNEEDWAVVAGINFYPGLQRDLQGPVIDGETFKKWALDNGYVPNGQLLCALSPDAPPSGIADARPTVEEISKHFETLIKEAGKRKFHRLGRRLYLFFSGHGIVALRTGLPNFNEAMLLAANAEQLLLKHVGLRSWAEWFRGLGI